MDDFYEKLGNLLNEKIENDENPQRSNEKADETASDNTNEVKTEQIMTEECQNDDGSLEKRDAGSEHTNESDTVKVDEKSEKASKIRVKIPKAHENSTGEVIKMHKYAEFPAEIAYALATLDIAYPVTLKNIKKRYHELIKQYHPDSNLSQKEYTVNNCIQVDINTIISSYELLEKYFNR